MVETHDDVCIIFGGGHDIKKGGVQCSAGAVPCSAVECRVAPCRMAPRRAAPGAGAYNIRPKACHSVLNAFAQQAEAERRKKPDRGQFRSHQMMRR